MKTATSQTAQTPFTNTPGEATKPDPAKLINITNNSGEEISILTPTTEDPTKVSNGIAVYNQRLVILKDTNGCTDISNTSNKNFLLDQYYKDPDTGKETYSTIYNVLGQTSSWYMPVANLGVMQILNQYEPQLITADDYSAMKSAGNFFQTISSYPSSKLSTDFQTAMSKTTSDAASKADGSTNSSKNINNSITENVNNFFKSTTDYKNVTLANLVAMETYYQDFPFAWASYDSSTFYLYSSNGKQTSFMGTITLTKPTTIDLTKANGDYKCTYAPAADPSDTSSLKVDTAKSKGLLYTNSLFVYSENPDDPSLGIKGTFQVKSTLTQKAGDTEIIPVLTGTIGGIVCSGFNTPQRKNSPDDSEFWNLVFHPKGAQQIFQSIMMWGGALMMLHFAYSMLSGIYNKLFGKKQPTTEEMFKEMKKDLSDQLEQQSKDIADRMSNNQNPGPDNPVDALEMTAEQRGLITDASNADRLSDSIESMEKSLETLAEYSQDMTAEQLENMEQLGTKLQDMQAKLDSASLKDIHQVVEDVQTDMASFSSDVNDFSGEISDLLSEQAKTQIADNARDVENISNEIDTANEEQEKIANEEDPAGEPIEPE